MVDRSRSVQEQNPEQVAMYHLEILPFLGKPSNADLRLYTSHSNSDKLNGWIKFSNEKPQPESMNGSAREEGNYQDKGRYLR